MTIQECGLTDEQYQTLIELGKKVCEHKGADEVRIEKQDDGTFALYAVSHQIIASWEKDE